MLEVWCTTTSLVGQADIVTAIFAQFKVSPGIYTSSASPKSDTLTLPLMSSLHEEHEREEKRCG